jgi:acyl-CoA thioesterase I
MSLIKIILTTLGVIVAGLLLTQATRLLLLKRSITTYKNYWDKQNIQAAEANSLLYVALGDSTAQGIGASRPEKGYVGLLAKKIAENSGQSVRVINLSTTGAKIQDVINNQLPRLQQIQQLKGSIVTIEVGANDLGVFDPARFNNQMEELLKQLPPQTIVADMPYFGGGRANGREVDAKNASVIIRKLASSYSLRVATLHEVTKQNDSILVYGADFFHPNNKGYVNWYKAFETALYP